MTLKSMAIPAVVALAASSALLPGAAQAVPVAYSSGALPELVGGASSAGVLDDIDPFNFTFTGLAAPSAGTNSLHLFVSFENIDLDGDNEFLSIFLNGFDTGFTSQPETITIDADTDDTGSFAADILFSLFGGFAGGSLQLALMPSLDGGQGIDFGFNQGSVTARISYDAVAPIPLPAGLPLLAGGLGLMGLLASRRRKTSA